MTAEEGPGEGKGIAARLVVIALLAVLCAFLAWSIARKREALILKAGMTGEFSLNEVLYGLTKLPHDGPLALSQEQILRLRQLCWYLREEERADAWFTHKVRDILTAPQADYLTKKARERQQTLSCARCRRIVDALRRTAGAARMQKIRIPEEFDAGTVADGRLLTMFLLFYDDMESRKALRVTADTARRILPYATLYADLLKNDNAQDIADLFTVEQSDFIREAGKQMPQERPCRATLRSKVVRMLWPEGL
jgi:hypothetical protein